MEEPLLVPVGRLFVEDETLLGSYSEIQKFWYSIHAEYFFLIKESTIFQKAVRIRVKQVSLVDSWLEKQSEKVLQAIPLADENGRTLSYTRKILDGWYYAHVYCFVLDIFLAKIHERQSEFWYFRNTLKKQGWVMSVRFERALIDDGIFLTREKDPTKRIPYHFMEQLKIVMR